VKVVTHLIDVHYETPAVLAAAVSSILQDADYPKSWVGHRLGSVSEDLNRLVGHRSVNELRRDTKSCVSMYDLQPSLVLYVYLS
jgi:hypothetical protein